MGKKTAMKEEETVEVVRGANVAGGTTGMERLILARALDSIPDDEEIRAFTRVVVAAAVDDILEGDVDLLPRTQKALEDVRREVGDEGAQVVALLRDRVHQAVVSIARSFGTRMVRIYVRRPEQVDEQEVKAKKKAVEKAAAEKKKEGES